MNRTSLVICLAASMAATVGCSSKNYVKQQTTPLINKTNELDDLTAKNTRDIKDVDARAQAGIQAVNTKTTEVEQKTQTAAQNATQAQQVADAANGRVSVLTNTVVNLDNYHPVAETSWPLRSQIPRATSSLWKAEPTRLVLLITTMILASAVPTR
jgi:OOP family OmpA-OmpF porin